MGNNAVIREGVLSDLDAIMHVEQICFTIDGFSRRQFRNLLTAPTSKVFITMLSGQVIGHGVTLINSLRNGQTKGRIYSIAVLPEHEHQGYGQLLSSHMHLYLSSIPVAYITAECDAGNQRLIKRNMLAGYRITDRLEGYYADGSDALRWRKDL
jgi:ribosomal protein S18 acetylase RimI-like enzyme